MAEDRLLRAWEVAERLGVSTEWVLDKYDAGELRGVRTPRRGGSPVRFRWSDVEKLLRRQERAA